MGLEAFPYTREALESQIAQLRAVVNELQARVSGGKDYLGPASCVCGRREDGHVTGWRRDCDVHGDPAVTMPPGWLSPDCPGCTAAAVRVERVRAFAADQQRQADRAWRLLSAYEPVDRERAEVIAAERDRERRWSASVEAEVYALRSGVSELLEHGVEALPQEAIAKCLVAILAAGRRASERLKPAAKPAPANPALTRADGQLDLIEARLDAATPGEVLSA